MSGRGTQITALVELDVGGQRGGVAAPEDVLKLVRFIDASPSITFGGIQAYHGIAQHARRHEERREFVTQARRKLGRTRSLLDEHDFVVGTITGGGTGTAELDAATGIYNEIQAGSYIFGDVDYSKNLDENGEPISKWKQSLFVLGTVVSNHDRFGSSGCMIDVGMKGVSFDSGPPVVVGHPEVEFVNLGDEHSYLKGPRLDIGSQVKLVPGHCDPTVNLYPFLVAVKGKTVRDIWAVDGRGPGL